MCVCVLVAAPASSLLFDCSALSSLSRTHVPLSAPQDDDCCCCWRCCLVQGGFAFSLSAQRRQRRVGQVERVVFARRREREKAKERILPARSDQTRGSFPQGGSAGTVCWKFAQVPFSSALRRKRRRLRRVAERDPPSLV